MGENVNITPRVIINNSQVASFLRIWANRSHVPGGPWEGRPPQGHAGRTKPALSVRQIFHPSIQGKGKYVLRKYRVEIFIIQLIFFNKDFIYFQRGEGREKERERNINVWLPLTCPLLGTWPATQACDPGWEMNQ